MVGPWMCLGLCTMKQGQDVWGRGAAGLWGCGTPGPRPCIPRSHLAPGTLLAPPPALKLPSTGQAPDTLHPSRLPPTPTPQGHKQSPT